MSFHYSDKHLNELNRDKHVYSVNSEFAKRENKYLVTSKNTNELAKNETNTIETSDGQEFRVIATKSDKATGFDGMAVAPIVDGQVDYSSVAVVAAGTDPDNKEDNPALGGFISRDAASAIEARQSSISPQYAILDSFIKKLLENQGITIVHLTGYSQSSYSLKAGAKYGIPTTTFNAWFKYSALTLEEKQFILDHSELFRDFRTKSDNVVIFNDNNNPYANGYDIEMGTIHWVDGSSHKIEDWHFDPVTGQVLDKKGGQPIYSLTSTALRKSHLHKFALSTLKAQWEGTDKKIDKGEHVFLDAAQAQALGLSLVNVSLAGQEELSLEKELTDQEAQEIWDRVDFYAYSYLSPSEVESHYSQNGVTKEAIVSNMQTHTQDKLTALKNLTTEWETLKTNFDKGIETLIATDSRLAGDFIAWQTETMMRIYGS